MIGLVTARMALLVDRFHLSEDRILKLTDRQIHEVYFHKRDKDGSIEVPMPTVEAVQEEEVTGKTFLRDLLLYQHLFAPEEFERLRAEAMEKYGEADAATVRGDA